MKSKQKPMRTFRITDAYNRELGEAAGRTRVESVINLHKMDPKGPQVSKAAAEKMVRTQAVRFERVA